MAQHVSPGVFTKIIDLSQFVQAVPSTIGFMCALTEKGEDNTLKFIGGRADFIAEFGEPNIVTYGKNYGQGPYMAYNYLGESGAFYFIRCLSDDAAYSNIRLDATFGATDTTASISVTFVDSLNSETEIKTNLVSTPPVYPVCFLYPIGRGQWYNNLGVRITEVANPTLWDQYIIDIYERQSDGEDEIIESFEISFDPNVISYSDLVRLHLSSHDPTTLNQQGADKGTQYRSVIFAHDEEQKQNAKQVITDMQPLFDKPIVTEVQAFTAFYIAADSHQNYYAKNSDARYCQIVIEPKLRKLREKISKVLRKVDPLEK